VCHRYKFISKFRDIKSRIAKYKLTILTFSQFGFMESSCARNKVRVARQTHNSDFISHNWEFY